LARIVLNRVSCAAFEPESPRRLIFSLAAPGAPRAAHPGMALGGIEPMARKFQFEPVNRGALWTRLNLTTAQLAGLCDLTTRQVSYWAQKGYLPRSPQNPERFNGNAVDTCVLIKQALDSGASLGQAARMATEYLGAALREQPQMDSFGPPVLLDMYEKLTAAEATLRMVRAVIEPQLPPRDAAAAAGDIAGEPE
jgi:DNA-binding transcriptional MerR regulator